MPEEGIIKREMPHSREAELSVIGAMLIDKDAIDTASEYISSADFYSRPLGVYFDAICELHAKGSEADPVTLQEKLKEKNLSPEFTSGAYIAELINSVPTSANVKYYCEIVSEHSTRRRLIHVSEDVMNDCYNATKELPALLDEVEKNIFDVTQRQNKGEFTDIGTLVVEALNRISAASRNKGVVTGLATGYTDLDYDTTGFQPSDLILIAARPSMGKTALALNIAQYMVMHDRHTVAIFSLEMSKEQLVNRLFAMESLVSAQNIRTGNLTESEWEQLVTGAGAIAGTNLIIDDTPGITVSELRSKCRRFKMEHDLKAIFIDYLQLMNPSRSRAGDSRQQEISEISRALKAVARELQVPVIALSQLSRAVESRTDHRPMLSDLRESGAIEQDADVVIFIYREDYYIKDTENKGVAEIIIAKQRNGPIGTIELLWHPEHMRFLNKKRH